MKTRRNRKKEALAPSEDEDEDETKVRFGVQFVQKFHNFFFTYELSLVVLETTTYDSSIFLLCSLSLAKHDLSFGEILLLINFF